MGKSVPSTTTKLQQFSRIISADRARHSNLFNKPTRAVIPPPDPDKPRGVRLKMEESSSAASFRAGERLPLASVVSDCARRWFQDTLKEAKAGDTTMQVLVGQMYNTGYGVPLNAQKGKAWINRASKSRSSVWRVSEKRPGYNASDSDSDDVKADASNV